MSFSEIVAVIASIVAIIGGIPGIIQAYTSKDSPFHRNKTTIDPQKTPAVPPPSISPYQPNLTKMPKLQSYQSTTASTPPNLNKLQIGAIYGSILIIPEALISVGFISTLHNAILDYGLVNVLVNYLLLTAGIVIYTYAGLATAKRSGSITSAIIAASILAIALGLINGYFNKEDPYSNFVFGFVVGLLLGMVGMVISTIAGAFGRSAHRRDEQLAAERGIRN